MKARPNRKRELALTLYLTGDEFLQLKSAAEEDGESMSAVIRAALRQLYSRRGRL
jgi:hypothetical protein